MSVETIKLVYKIDRDCSSFWATYKATCLDKSTFYLCGSGKTIEDLAKDVSCSASLYEGVNSCNVEIEFENDHKTKEVDLEELSRLANRFLNESQTD
jgi:hypothetical protein